MPKQEKLYEWQPDIPEGRVRIYTDHTGRWYEDVTVEEAQRRADEASSDEFLTILREAIQKEVDREIVERVARNITGGAAISVSVRDK